MSDNLTYTEKIVEIVRMLERVKAESKVQYTAEQIQAMSNEQVIDIIKKKNNNLNMLVTILEGVVDVMAEQNPTANSPIYSYSYYNKDQSRCTKQDSFWDWFNIFKL